MPDREGLHAQTFVDISDTLVADFDDMDEAFSAMREYARRNQQNLTDVAREIASRGPIVDEVLRLHRSARG